MSRALPKYNKRRVGLVGGATALVLSGAVVVGSAMAGEDEGAQAAAGGASPGTVNCPAVEPSLPAVPASAQAEIDRNLTLLNTQIAEADKRLIDTVGQGGPNFIQNAILGPLEDKRVATINRMATAIGRTAAKPQGLDSLAPCTLGSGNASGGQDEAPSAPPADQDNGSGGDDAAAGGASPGTVNCPAVEPSLPAVPASAQAEIDRNLTLLNTQIAEADKRLIDTVGQGGPNFIQNAILGPLEDKRVATINRMATAIGRTAAKPQGLDSLAPCTLNQ